MSTQLEFKDIASKIGSGVSIVTFKNNGVAYGLTISSFTCVSVQPAAFLICVDKKHVTNKLLLESGCFALHVLNEEQKELSNLFAFGKPEERFLGDKWVKGNNGSPVLTDCICFVECTVQQVFNVESHSVIIGSVTHSFLNDSFPKPLIYWNRNYRRIIE
jgi:flavin reductase (DIM6/NTAB) family NADH-FMN oxidoreductase RutF